MDFDIQYIKVNDYLEKIEEKFLKAHLENPLSTPDDYNLDVKSYCILCHAAFEEFVELIALQVMNKSIKLYTIELKLTKPLISLMHFKSSHANYLESNTETLSVETIETIYDYNRVKLDEIKSSFSKEVFNNHGVSLKYLRKLLMPVSVDIPKDVNWSNSLEKLANERGAYAHKFLEKGRVKQSIEPEEAKIIVSDCLSLCLEIKNRAKKLID
ncbi:HEPN domain-containing protein [Lunatibacter salilacus]|uniref:HEPN domain-containing protein n=1 Tax=Lunatibacter salilacus TaxID=2483804 RepID=UPI00131B2783|nr:HEPN domain-containing protein [Lunatibacter salilacus]